MNPSFIRLLTPFVKVYRKLHPSENLITNVPLQLSELAGSDRSSRTSQLSLIYNLPFAPIEPSIRATTETTEEQEQSDDSTHESSVFQASNHLLRKNLIDHRVKSLQYQANNPCEDSIVYEQLKNLEAYTVSIFDGHGGPQLAEFSKYKINLFIDSYLKEHLPSPKDNKSLDVSQIIKDSITWSYKQLEQSFFQIYQQQLKLGNKKIRSVGACGITAIVHNDRVYIGNAGDSQGIFVLSEGGKTMKTQKINQRLSVNNKAERERIKNEWKDIEDGVITQESNNCYYLKGRLQPTRTIGDYYLKKEDYYYGEGPFKGPYLSCQPDINEFQLTSAHKYMVLASDGVWDFLSRNEVMHVMMNEREIDLNKTCYQQQRQQEEGPYIFNILDSVLSKCSEITGKSVQQVKMMEKGRRRNYHDDITIAVINLGFQI